MTVYFSNTGHTRKAAERLNELIGGDLYEIIPETPYPKSFPRCVIKAVREKIKDTRPEIKNPIKDVSSYTDILVGYPAWCGSCPKIILSFLEQINLNGKNLYLFNTDMGTGSVGDKEISSVLNKAVSPSIEVDKKSTEELLDWLKYKNNE